MEIQSCRIHTSGRRLHPCITLCRKNTQRETGTNASPVSEASHEESNLVVRHRLFSVPARNFGRAERVPATGPYRLLKTIPIGAEGGWDYAATDEVGRRVYVTHGTKIVVIDIDKDEVVGEIADTPGVHGFAVAPELGLGFSSNGRESKASIVDLKTLQTRSKVDTGPNPDGILYVPGAQEVYTFNRDRNAPSATVFEAGTARWSPPSRSRALRSLPWSTPRPGAYTTTSIARTW